MKEITIGKNQCGQRLDKFLAKYMKEASKGFLYKMLRKKNIKLNGKKAEGREMLSEGDVVTLYLSEETLSKFMGQDKRESGRLDGNKVVLSILYENEHIALIDKPAGMLSQRAGSGDMSLVEYFRSYVGSTEEGFSPGICNRLDRNTSGIVIGGKSLLGLQTISELLRERCIEKYYIAVVKGSIKKGDTAEGWLIKDPRANKVRISNRQTPDSSYIKTGYEPLGTDGKYTLLKVRLFTGKPHQIRSYLASISHPVAGDAKYGGRISGSPVQRQLLHAFELHFPKMDEPFLDLSGAVFRAGLPGDFYKDVSIRKLIQQYMKEEAR